MATVKQKKCHGKIHTTPQQSPVRNESVVGAQIYSHGDEFLVPSGGFWRYLLFGAIF
jgi:hypothetical protein